jgi:glycosyltransferase
LKVSIITAVYNAETTIEDCIKSVCTQTCPDIEHIIIDGGSTDRTLDIVRENETHISKCVSGKDNGVYDAMNKGLDFASGQIIAFLNADDFYASGTIVSEIVGFMQKNCFDAVYGDLVYIARNDSEKIVRYWQPGKFKPGAFRRGWAPPHPTFFCKKEIYDEYGCFNDNFQVAADFELMLRFLERYKIKAGYLPKIFVKMRTGGKANIIRGIIRGNSEIIRSFKMNNLSISPNFFICKPITKVMQLVRC